MAFGSYIFSVYFKVTTKYLVMANLIFFVVESLTLLTIFFFAVKQEEVRDTRTLSDLTNRINKKGQKGLDQQRCYLKMKQLGADLTDADYDRMFRFHLNLFRMESLRYWCGKNHDSNRMLMRLQEICFFNSSVLCRIHN